MNPQNLIIQLLPSYDSTAEAHGYDASNDDADGEAITFLQGNDIDQIEVEPGQRFEISIDFENGTIDCDEINYRLIKKNDLGQEETIEETSQIILEPGEYQFHNDGITISEISF